MRRIIVWMHRWVGLALAIVLIIEGVTGSLLAYRADLTRWLDPAPRPAVLDAPLLDFGTLADRADAQLAPRAAVAYFFAPADGRLSMRIRALIDPATGQPYPLAQLHTVADATSGQLLDPPGASSAPEPLSARVMPFVYELHTVLALGDMGRWILGISALVWTLDCLWSVVLTLPVSLQAFWRRWGISWRIKWHGGATRVNFDLHRAGGLWTWAALFVFAWSSVYLTLPQVYEPVTGALFDYATYGDFDRSLPHRYREVPGLNWRAAQMAGDRLIRELAVREHFTMVAPVGMAYFPDNDLYSYTVRTTRHFPEAAEYGIYLDAEDGRLLRIDRMSGEHTGNTISNWLYALHLVRDPVDGAMYRLFVCVMGAVSTLITVTGLVIWWKKRSARRWARGRQAPAATAPRISALTRREEPRR